MFVFVQVLPQDVDSQYGIAHSPIGPSPSQSPLAFRPFGSAPTGPPSAYSSALARTASASNNSNMSSTALARTASATGSGNISRLSESTSREEVTGISDGPRVSSEVTGVSSGEVLTAAQGSQQSLTTALAEDKRHQSAVSLTSDADSLPASDPAASQPSTEGKSAVSELDTTATASALSEAKQQSAASGEQADTGGLQIQAGQLSINTALAAGPEAASEGVQAANTAPAAAPNDAELQQSMDAMLSGEDQAMQESLAAANAAAGEHVGDFLPSRSSGLQQLSIAESSSDHTSPPEEEAAALAAGASPAGDGPTNDEAIGEQHAEATGSNQQPGLEPADGPALEKSNGSGQIADRYRSVLAVYTASSS